MKIYTAILAGLVMAGTLTQISLAHAGPADFKAGTAIPEFGEIAPVNVDADLRVKKNTKFKIVFDVNKQADVGGLNRNFVTAARFINMHVEAGARPKNINLAIVLHGKAAKDVTRAKYYDASQEGDDVKQNASAVLVQTLLDHGVKFYVCGQTASYYDIKNDDLLPGVQMALSAMTAHALLQQKGYTLNPF